jgi:ribose transport system ATP-binding protein
LNILNPARAGLVSHLHGDDNKTENLTFTSSSILNKKIPDSEAWLLMSEETDDKMMGEDSILLMKNVNKSFPGVHALKGVELSCRRGEVHALIGHNGAGKSTLIKILGGVYHADEGTILFKGKTFKPTSPLEAANAGISIIHQEFNLIPDLSVAQNIFLGREPVNKWGIVDRKKMFRGAWEVMERFEITDINPQEYIRDLSVNQLQLVEIAKALSTRSEIIVMDEPTAALPLPDVRKLFHTIRELKASGVTIIYISHRLEEIFEICDRASLMKDGRMLDTVSIEQVNRGALVEKMVGRSIIEFFPRHAAVDSEGPCFQIANFQSAVMKSAVSFEVRTGEIFGITGLEGCGATELARGIFGVDRRLRGEVLLDGQPVDTRSPRKAIMYGLGLVTKDRRKEGLILTSSVFENMMIPLRINQKQTGILKLKQEYKAADFMVEKLGIKAASLLMDVESMSGGNQQKVILAKWLLTKCRVLLVDEPTRGVDVESKVEIYKLLRELVEQGVIVIVVSSDMEEVLGLCDRILVLHRGKIEANLSWNKASEKAVMLAATGCALDSNGHPLASAVAEYEV